MLIVILHIIVLMVQDSNSVNAMKSMLRHASPYTTLMIVPTGVGASIGGYAGDALPYARLLASVSDRLITHPNVMNGAMLYYNVNNILYVEGYALDEFASNRLSLLPLNNGGHKIGLLLDSGMSNELKLRHIQVADACKATLGLNIHSYTMTSCPIGVNLALSESGASWGSIDNINTIIESSQKLINSGCTAIAVVARFPEDDEDENENELFDAYRQGNGVDAIAGAEALISHIITKEFQIPCAHAPAFDAMDVEENVSPKAAAEELGYTFLPCVLSYLHRAPLLLNNQVDQLDHHTNTNNQYSIHRDDVDTIIVPIDCLGGPAVLSFARHGTLIIAVEENTTQMDFGPEQLLDIIPGANLVIAKSYLEAVGLIQADRYGINLDSSTCNQIE